MSRRVSSLDKTTVGIDRDVSSQYDNVKIVATHIDDVTAIANSIGAVTDIFTNLPELREVAQLAEVASTEALASANAAALSEANADSAAADAASHDAMAEKWAVELEDVEVEPGKYSALHSAAKAEDSALAASTSEINAALSASSVSTDAESAALSAANALTSSESAALSASEAVSASASAEGSAINATTSENTATTAVVTATTKADEASISAANAASSEVMAERWAVETYGTEIETDKYSSSHYAMASENFSIDAAASEASAATSELNAATSAANALSSETAAANSANSANISANAAADSATNAALSETNAGTSETAADASASNALTSETNAAISATNAATSEANALISANNSASSAAESLASVDNSAASAAAALTSENNAKASELAAVSSEVNAAASEAKAEAAKDIAVTKANDASISAANALSSENNAFTSASNAATSEANIATSESNAATSAANALASENNAAASEANAATSEANAATSKSNAATSAANAATSEVNAALSATSASDSASSASISAGNAATSATAAATSASSANTAADAALAALDSFDDRYLGQKTEDPTTDNDGNPLIAGALYFNTTIDTMLVYEGSVWVAAYASLSGALLAANNLADVDDASTARVNLGLEIGANVQAYNISTVIDATYVHTDNNYDDAAVIKLAGIAPNADVNNISDANATDLTDGNDSSLHYHSSDRNRTNHTGTQVASTISDFAAAVQTNETTTSLSLNANILTFVDEDGVSTDIDLSLYLDDTNLARLTSGTLDGATGIATFTRDDTTTFTIDFSALLDDTQVVVEDSLVSTSIINALSANQGKWLNDNKVNNSQVLTDVPIDAVFTDTTYSIGDGGLTEINFTTTKDAKLSGIEDGATADQTKTEIDALGIDAATVNGLAVETAVPSGAVFTDTTYSNVSEFTNDAGYLTTETDPVFLASEASSFVAGDKDKLDGIEAGAEVNNISDIDATDLTDSGDTYLHYHSSDRDRANHTGTQTASTISDFDSAVQSAETVTSLSLSTNILTYVDENGTSNDIDLSLYLDDTNLARLTSGTLDGATGIATFTRDDTSTFTVDFSALLDDTTVTVEDNLTSTSTVNALSANQGKQLNDNKVDNSRVLTDVPAGAVFTDTTYTNVSEFTNDAGYLTSETDPIFTASEASKFVAGDKLKLDGIETGATADQTKADIDALGIDAATVNGKTVETSVPAGAVFTDTIYDDSGVLKDSDIGTTVLAPDGDGSNLTGIDALPDQTGHAGKYLTTNGTVASWSEISTGAEIDDNITSISSVWSSSKTSDEISSQLSSSLVSTEPVLDVSYVNVNEAATSDVVITNYNATSLYSVYTSNPSLFTVDLVGNTITVTGVGDGVATLTLSVMDSGKSIAATKSITVTVNNVIVDDDAVVVNDFSLVEGGKINFTYDDGALVASDGGIFTSSVISQDVADGDWKSHSASLTYEGFVLNEPSTNIVLSAASSKLLLVDNLNNQYEKEVSTINTVTGSIDNFADITLNDPGTFSAYMYGACISSDGMMAYSCGDSLTIYYAPLSVKNDVSSTGTISSYSLPSPSVSFDRAVGMCFTVNGRELYLVDRYAYSSSYPGIVHYTLSVPWDITTATYTDSADLQALVDTNSISTNYNLFEIDRYLNISVSPLGDHLYVAMGRDMSNTSGPDGAIFHFTFGVNNDLSTLSYGSRYYHSLYNYVDFQISPSGEYGFYVYWADDNGGYMGNVMASLPTPYYLTGITALKSTGVGGFETRPYGFFASYDGMNIYTYGTSEDHFTQKQLAAPLWDYTEVTFDDSDVVGSSYDRYFIPPATPDLRIAVDMDETQVDLQAELPIAVVSEDALWTVDGSTASKSATFSSVTDTFRHLKFQLDADVGVINNLTIQLEKEV